MCGLHAHRDQKRASDVFILSFLFFELGGGSGGDGDGGGGRDGGDGDGGGDGGGVGDGATGIYIYGLC